MRYFTRQLYQQFNSADDEEADRADEAWEAAIEKYRQQFRSCDEESALRFLRCALRGAGDGLSFQSSARWFDGKSWGECA